MHDDSDGGDPSRLRQFNERAVLAAVGRSGRVRVAEIVERTGLGRTAVEKVLLSLVERRWLVEEQTIAGARGRPARSYRFRAEAGYVGGVDIGAHSVRAVLTDLSGELIATSHETVRPAMRRRTRLKAAESALSSCLDAAGAAPSALWALGVGTTGVVDRRGRVRSSRAIPDWQGADLAAQFRRTRSALVIVENDTHLAAVAEHQRGCARDVADLVLLQAGRRTGLSVVVDGTVRRGFNGAAGNLSSLPMVRWEAAIEYLHRCTAVPHGMPIVDRAEWVFAAARAGNRPAMTAIRRYVAEMAVAAATAIAILDPQLLVVGGAFSQSADLILDLLADDLERVAGQVPELRGSTLGAECVALGAVCVAQEQLDRLLAPPRGPLPDLIAPPR
ncbi:ROK family protein [Kribbella sp. NPDC000426]|uniref:ROK family transcriptional regulator n=1 Tax=Kribbella sp. NPDC000426 TaxID=3154255 RepID=UPI00332E6BA0